MIAGGITGHLDGKCGLEGWRWLFIVEGAMTAGWSLCAHFILLDFPANTKKFTERERELAVQRIIADSLATRTDGPPLGHIKALKLALSSWKTWAFTIGYMVS